MRQRGSPHSGKLVHSHSHNHRTGLELKQGFFQPDRILSLALNIKSHPLFLGAMVPSLDSHGVRDQSSAVLPLSSWVGPSCQQRRLSGV